MDNNYNNDQQNNTSEPYGQQNGYSDQPAQSQDNGYTAQNDMQNSNYGQNNSNSFGSQNNYDQTNNFGGAQNNSYGQPNNNVYGPQNSPYGQPQQSGPQYGPQNNPFGQPNNNPYGPYMQNPYLPPQQEEGSVGLAVASMVLGICAILFSCCFYPIAFLLSLIGLILGAVAIKKGPAGKGMAVTGLILSIISIGIAVVILLFAASLGIGSGLSDLF